MDVERSCRTFVSLFASVFLIFQTAGNAQEIGSPEGIKSEQSLPSRYEYVVRDLLKFCQPAKGFWIDLGAGKGQVAIPLIERTTNPVTMLDPNAEGETTASYIADRLRPTGVPLTRIAYGMPLGGDLEYADHVTIARSVENRRKID